MRKSIALVGIIMILGATGTKAQQSDPPAKPPAPAGQHSPQGDPGQLETDSEKGSNPSNPQGGTPNAMQVKPEGSDKKGDHK